MAKGQKRSNREVKKPKAVKRTVAQPTSSTLTKATPTPLPARPPKKKG